MERRSSRNAAAVESRAAVTVWTAVESWATVTVWPAVEPWAAVELWAAVTVRPAVEPWAAVTVRPAVEFRASMKSWAAAVEMVVADEGAAVRDIPVVVEHHAVAAPVGVPVVPSPAESTVEADPETDSERNSRAGGVQAGVPEPAGVCDERRAVDQPRIVGRHVDHLGVCGLDHDRLTLRDDVFLRGGLEVARLLGSPAHRLHGVEHGLLLVHVCVAQRRRPGEVLVHVRQHGGKLRDRLDARIPGLLIDGLGQLLPIQFGVLLHPTVRLHDLGGVRRGGED